MTKSETEQWLSKCAEIFDGEGGYVPLPGGGYEFAPAPLREQVPTSTLVSLLTAADMINADEDYRHILSIGDNYRTLIKHINRRAYAGDIEAATILEQRMARLMAED